LKNQLYPKFVIAESNLPKKFPFAGIAVWFLLLDHFSAPEWVFWAFFIGAALALYGYHLDSRRTFPISLIDPPK
jgi:hypothetical protein